MHQVVVHGTLRSRKHTRITTQVLDGLAGGAPSHTPRTPSTVNIQESGTLENREILSARGRCADSRGRSSCRSPGGSNRWGRRTRWRGRRSFLRVRVDDLSKNPHHRFASRRQPPFAFPAVPHLKTLDETRSILVGQHAKAPLYSHADCLLLDRIARRHELAGILPAEFEEFVFARVRHRLHGFTRACGLSLSGLFTPTLTDGVPFLWRSVPEKERRGGRVDFNVAPREQIPTAVSGRLMRSGRQIGRAHV